MGICVLCPSSLFHSICSCSVRFGLFTDCIVILVFFAFFWVRYGRTLGMQAWRLRVQDAEGHNITLLAALKRYLVAYPSLLAFGLGYWVMLLDPMKRSWSDRASGTRVVLHHTP